MRELISHPGIQYYVLKLQGTLSNSMSINGKPRREFHICDSDFEGISEQVKDEDQRPGLGNIIATEGLELLLVKNAGVLEMTFEGRHGEIRSWICYGLKICGMVGTQTETGEVGEVGEEGMKKAPVMKDIDTQTGHIAAEHVEMELEKTQATREITQRETGVQTDLLLPKDAELINAKYRKQDGSIWYWRPIGAGGYWYPETEEHANLGLVAIRHEQRAQSSLKRARTQSSEQMSSGLPRHLYMTGDEKLGHNPGPGRLHIDRETQKIFFERYHEKSFIRDNDYKVSFTNGKLNIVRVCKTGDVLRWKSTHANKPKPYGNNNGSWDKDSTVTLEDFVQVVKVCLRPRTPVTVQQVTTSILPATSITAPTAKVTLVNTRDNQSNTISISTVDRSSSEQNEDIIMADAKDKDRETINISQASSLQNTEKVTLSNTDIQGLNSATESACTRDNDLKLIAEFNKKKHYYSKLKSPTAVFSHFENNRS